MRSLKVALIGNPNCGKTTLFNGLTGAHQKVGNWPGVTIERKVGFFTLADGQRVELVDLPGIYSLEQDEYGLDEQIAKDFLSQNEVDVVINLVDANSLDRQLLLTHQLRDYDIPMLVAVNMLDVAQVNKIDVDLDQLSKSLELPVVGIVASKHSGAVNIRESLALAKCFQPTAKAVLPSHDGDRVMARLSDVKRWVFASVTQQELSMTLSDRIDRVVLNKYLGFPIFLLAMYLLFTFAINVGAVFIDFFDILLGAWLVDGAHQLLTFLHAPAWLSVLIANGLGGGIQLVGTFIPVIGFLYLGLSLLEGSGYIVRAAFVVDRLMQSIGLPGKSFVPLIVGFGCNVPSIMATRTLDRESDRMVTIAMTPFMSCGARLTVYALFASAFFGNSGQNVVFALYLLGIAMAVLTGWIFRKALYRDELGSSIMEMPVYHVPSMRNVFMTTWHRLRGFIARAGKTIVGVVVVLSFLNSWGVDGTFGNEDSQKSMLSVVSQKATPLLAPIGVQADNWPATVGIVTGIFAKEAVVGTLDSLYSDVAGLADEDSETLGLWASTGAAIMSIWDNASALSSTLTDPLGITVGSYDSLDQAAQEQDVRTGTLLTMATLFVSPFAAFCYLVFILLYTPCVAAMGALVRESGGKWSWIVISWSTVLAYATATIFYQAGTLLLHPVSSVLWIAGMLGLVAVYIGLIKQIGKPVALTDQVDLIPTKSL